MNPKKTPILFFVILVLTSAVIITNLLVYNQNRQTLTIGLTPQQNTLIDKTKKMNLDAPYKVKFVIYDNEQALLQAIYAKNVDVFILDTYSYIEQYAKLPSSRAILGVPSDYYLIATSESPIIHPRVGMLSSSLPEHLLSGTVYSKYIYNDYNECLQALSSGLIDQAVLQEKYVDLKKFMVLTKLSSLGYKEDLLIVSTPWLEKNDEEDLSLLQNINTLFNSELLKPNEAQLVDVMTELFTSEIITTRYYYKDLVYTTGL
ncbi:substrate-binding domain-containing protein [Fusibacter bizertensis]